MRTTPVTRDPFGSLRDFDQLVRRTFGPAAFEVVDAPSAFRPNVESLRDGDDALIRLELPGLDVERDVQVELVDGRLVISGTRRDERAEETDARGHLREFRYGSFRRSFRVGRGVSAEAVTAGYDAGVLTVRVAGAFAEPAGQRIAISSGAGTSIDGVVEGADEA